MKTRVNYVCKIKIKLPEITIRTKNGEYSAEDVEKFRNK